MLGLGGLWLPPTFGNDLSVIDHYLTLTPAQRLKKSQDIANFILRVRRLNGIEGLFLESTDWENMSSTGENYSGE